MNVLITSAGRRASLVRAFQDAAHPAGGRVLAADMDPLAPALYVADGAFAMPSLSAPDYLDCLVRLIEEQAVGLLVPTIDTELLPLASNARLFAERGCHPLISSETFVRIAADKWLTVEFFSRKGIRTPRSWLPERVGHDPMPDDLFIKPRQGSASQNAFRVSDDSLEAALALVPDPIVQERVAGPEITIDAFIDFDGAPLHYVPRLRIKTVGGESVQGITIPDDDLRQWLAQVLEACSAGGARGPITLQAFLTNDGPCLSEVNPRFGGGFPLANAAGGRYPEWVVRILCGEKMPCLFGAYSRGLYMTRHYVERFTEAPMWS